MALIFKILVIIGLVFIGMVVLRRALPVILFLGVVAAALWLGWNAIAIILGWLLSHAVFLVIALLVLGGIVVAGNAVGRG